MSGQCEATRQSDEIRPPMVDASGNPNVVSIATSTTVAGVDLSTIPGAPGSLDPQVQALDRTPLGHYIEIAAVGADVYLLFGPTFASVTGANAPLPATNNTVSGAGAVTMAKQVCMVIPAGTSKHFKLMKGAEGGSNGPQGQASPHRFVGLVTASGTGSARIYQSSP